MELNGKAAISANMYYFCFQDCEEYKSNGVTLFVKNPGSDSGIDSKRNYVCTKLAIKIFQEAVTRPTN